MALRAQIGAQVIRTGYRYTPEPLSGSGEIWLNNRQQHQLHADPDLEYSGQGMRLALSLGYAFADRFVAFAEVSGLQVHDN